LDDKSFDAIVIIAKELEDLTKNDDLYTITQGLKKFKTFNSNFEKETNLCVVSDKRIIYSATGPIDRDYDDVRRVATAAENGFKKALSSGSKRPVLINATSQHFELSDYVALLAAYKVDYIPFDVRIIKGREPKDHKFEHIGFYHKDAIYANKLMRNVKAIELGKIVARDIGGGDPEIMAPPSVVEYVQKAFKDTCIKVQVNDDVNEFEKNYPCFAAVNRASNGVPRHRGRIVKLEYDANDDIDTTLFLVGKGITYDTGGADIKYGGSMVGMCRDKCGAAFVAGFFKLLSILKPKKLKVHGVLCLARNNVGEESYVSDEIITSRANVRVKIGNTDAEGRMVMTDPLCECKDLAISAVNPQIFTIATLTGHVIRAYSASYSAILSNKPARNLKIDSSLQASGDLMADPYEISTIRREDYDFHRGQSDYEEVIQANNKPSTETPRGHQGPAAFLILASGLDKHGANSNKPIPYSHCDIAGSAASHPDIPSAAPMNSFFHKYVLPRI